MYVHKIEVYGPGIGVAAAAVELAGGLDVTGLCTWVTKPCNGLLPDPHNYAPWWIAKLAGSKKPSPKRWVYDDPKPDEGCRRPHD